MIGRLRTLLGESAVRAGRADDAVHDALPAAVIEPAGADACAAALAECSEHGWTVEIAGGRTAGAAGRPVERVDVLLTTARMSGVVEYEPDDLTIGVGAGTTLADLRARVAPSNQRAPLDAAIGRSTVGGALARAAAGPMRRSWGTPRRQVLGVELVTGDGRVLRVGGRVVKNVAGYDLNKLIVGSAGTLGVITRAHLRLLPAPAAAATVVLTARDHAALLPAVRALLDAAVQPAALELVGPPWRLIARHEGAAELVAEGVRVAHDAGRAAEAEVSFDEEALAELAMVEAAALVVVRVAHLPARLADTITSARRIAGGAGTIAAHAGDGIVRVLMPLAPSASEVGTIARSIEEARRDATGGTVIVERGTSELLRAVDPWGAQPADAGRLMRELRRQFDPAGILQRGRWLA